MKDVRVLFFIFLVIFITLVSFVSGYEIPPMKEMDKDIVLMLTPYGIIDFFILQKDHFLAPFYFEKPPVRFTYLTLIVFSFLPVLILAVWTLRYKKDPKE